MNQPIKSLEEAPSVGASPLAKTSIALASVVDIHLGSADYRRRRVVEQCSTARRNRRQPGAGRNAAPMSIVPETVGKGGYRDQPQCKLGTVTSLATVTVRSQISGQLVQIVFKEGDEVKKGDLLAENRLHGPMRSHPGAGQGATGARRKRC